ncbi:MAG: ABC transporter transmembrane domain-containing protein, partial [Actinomycetota bacterium]
MSRVTSDIETLTMFFSWGALVWLLDGSLMVVVACVMLSYDWILALVAFAVSAPLYFVLRNLQRRLVAAYDIARENNAELLGSISELVAGT